MRNYALAIAVGLGLAGAAALALFDSPLGGFLPHTPQEAATAVVPLPPAPLPLLETGPPAAPPAATTPPPTAEATPSTPAPEAAPAEAPAAAPDLPTVAVPDRPEHTVPEEEPPTPTVTLLDRKGRTVKVIKPSPSESVAAAPAASAPPPSFANTPAARGGAVTTPVTFNGAAQAVGATVLTVGARSVRLFGVRVADPRDHCGLGTGDNRSCADVARDALTQRLKRYPNVACRVPAGQRGSPAAVCSDASGTDLGGFLVAEGYALADTTQSYDYYGAEGVARAFRRGLWRNR
jgi:endonuclease YncB( thermonuclease family)